MSLQGRVVWRTVGEGRPQVVEPSGRTLNALEPIAADWLMQDVKNPACKRVLYASR